MHEKVVKSYEETPSHKQLKACDERIVSVRQNNSDVGKGNAHRCREMTRLLLKKKKNLQRLAS